MNHGILQKIKTMNEVTSQLQIDFLNLVDHKQKSCLLSTQKPLDVTAPNVNFGEVVCFLGKANKSLFASDIILSYIYTATSTY